MSGTPRSKRHTLSADDWRLLVESVQDYAIFMLDPDGYIATWNRGAEAIKGYSADDIIGSHFSRFYLPEDNASRLPERELEIARAVGRVEQEGFRLRKDGTRFWANVVITALRDESGTLRGFTKVTRDLTARRAGDEALRRSEERFRLLMEAVDEYAIYVLDPEGMVSTWNSGAEKIKGYKAAEIIGKHYALFFPEADVSAGKPVRELATAVRDGRFREEGWRVRKDGSQFWASVVVTPIRDGRGNLLGFAKVTRDLTERRKAEDNARMLAVEQAAREAAQANELELAGLYAEQKKARSELELLAQRAEEANRLKDEFLATVSHELRTPLNAILGWASVLRKRNTDKGAEKAIEIIHRNATAQGKIIEDILDTSRIITGKLRLELKTVDLNAVVRDALEVLRPSLTAKQLSLELETSKAPSNLIADPERLQQVVWNLLSNAVKFSDAGGTIHVRIAQEASALTLTVRDSGRGIEPSFLPFVFDRFKQADGSTTRRVGGLGLGLAIVRHLVELHGGQVEAKSPGLGLGTTFHITLPVHNFMHAQHVPESLADDTLVQASVPLEAKPLAGTRVLVVDDEIDTLELLAVVLSAAGALVEMASSASAALAALTRFRPHVLVSDIGMPDEDGYSFMQRVKALPCAEGGGIPALALTAYTRPQDRDRALAAGFSAHLGKPVDGDQLVREVASLIGLQKQPKTG